MIIGEGEVPNPAVAAQATGAFIALSCDILNDLISVTSDIVRVIVAWFLHCIGCSTRPIALLLSKVADC